jgi:hypothetical protein
MHNLHTNLFTLPYSAQNIFKSHGEFPWLLFKTLSLLLKHSNLFKVKFTLRLTISQSVNLGVEPHLGLMTRYLLLFWRLRSCFLWDAPSDERTGLSFVHAYAAGPCQRSLSRVRVTWDSWSYFTASDLRLPSNLFRTESRYIVSAPTTHRKQPLLL